jgi:hypothetical protein
MGFKEFQVEQEADMDDIYTTLINKKHQIFIDTADPQDSYQAVCLALTNAYLHKLGDAKQILQTLTPKKLAPFERAIYLETEAFIAYSNKDMDIEEVETKAREAVSLNPRAMLANFILGRVAEIKKNYETALSFYKLNSNFYPEDSGALFDCARILLLQKKPLEAIKYIRNTRPSIKKILYQIANQAYLKANFWNFLIILGLTVCFFTSAGPYVFFILTAVFLAGLILSLFRYKDPVLIGTIVSIQFILTVLYLIIRWLSHLQ